MDVGGRRAGEAVVDRSPPPARIIIVALSFAIGLLIGLHHQVSLETIIVVALALCVCTQSMPARPHCRIALTMIIVLLAGVGRGSSRQFSLPADHLLHHASSEATLIRIRGRVCDVPRQRGRPDHPLERFHRREPAWRISVDVLAVETNDGWRDASGRLDVDVARGSPDVCFGDVVDVAGWWVAPQPPTNPGAIDRRRRAWATGFAGWLRTADPALVIVTRKGRPASGRSMRAHIRRALRVDTDRPASDAFFQALLTGVRTAELQETDGMMRRNGLAHLLAISGLHVALLIGPCMLLVRGTRRYARWNGLVLIGIALLILGIVDVRVPIARAALMTMLFGASICTDRRIRPTSLLAVTMVILTALTPEIVRDVGFQLSFGIVLALMTFVRPVRVCWFGPANHVSPGWSRWFSDRVLDAFVVAIIAWLAALPIVIHHFGLVATYGALSSLLLTPLLTLVLLAGVVRGVLVLVLPGDAAPLNSICTRLADVLLAIGHRADDLPGAALYVPAPSLLWTCCAIVSLAAMLGGMVRHIRRAGVIGVLITMILLIIDARSPTNVDGAAITMLDVGDGTCIVLRSARSTVLFDAGSLRGPIPARRTIIDALRALDVVRLDAIVVSHANIDHFNGVPDVLDVYPSARIIVSPQFLRTAREGLRDVTPHTSLLHLLEERGATIDTAARGTVMQFGAVTWRWVHPPAAGEYEAANDTSFVIRLDIGDRAVLLTGDIQQDGMRDLRDDDALRGIDVLELPHHGSVHPAALDFVEMIDAEIVLQSTGAGRMTPDRWSHLEQRRRSVTSRDGAVTIHLADDGPMTVRPHHGR